MLAKKHVVYLVICVASGWVYSRLTAAVSSTITQQYEGVQEVLSHS